MFVAEIGLSAQNSKTNKEQSMTAPLDSAKIRILTDRLQEIRSLDHRSLDKNSKLTLKNEVRQIQMQLSKASNRGVYISFGALIVVCLLLILLL